MGTLSMFPAQPARPLIRAVDPEHICTIVIMPVVRIERYDDAPSRPLGRRRRRIPITTDASGGVPGCSIPAAKRETETMTLQTTTAGDRPAQSTAKASNTERINSHVGGRVRVLRIAASLSQEKLGDAVGVTFQQIQKYEKGVNALSGPMLYACAKALRCSVSDFFTGLDDPGDLATKQERAERAGTEGFLTSPQGASIARNFPRIVGPETKRLVVDLVATLAGPSASR